VFVAQPDKVQWMLDIPSYRVLKKNVHFLVSAFDPGFHKLVRTEKKYDWCFIGNLHEDKLRYINALKEAFPNCFVGKAFGEDMARIYAESKVIFNISYHGDVNMRMFEAMAMGGMLLTNANYNIKKVFDSEVAQYEEFPVACVERMKYYLENDGVREKIANDNLDEVLYNHTYKDRMRELLEVMTNEQST